MFSNRGTTFTFGKLASYKVISINLLIYKEKNAAGM